jgi:hypothetical protein
MDYLEISRSTVYRLMARGMPNIMVGSVHRYPRDQVVGWPASQSGNKLNNRETVSAELSLVALTIAVTRADQASRSIALFDSPCSMSPSIIENLC